jgi:hypothetical protein
MSRTSVAILLSVALLLGAAAGAYAGFTYATAILAGMDEATVATRATDDIASSVTMLESLRAGNPDALIRPLETRLDNGLITLAAFPREHLPAAAPAALRRAAEYRVKNPRKSDNPDAEAAIQRAFANAKE